MSNDNSSLIRLIIKEGILSNKTKLFDEVNLILSIDENKNYSLQQLNYKNFKNVIIDNNDISTVDKRELDFIAKEIEELEGLTENDNRLSEVVSDLKNIQSNLELSNIDKKCKAILEVYEVKKWLYRLLDIENEPVLESDFGCYWGRSSTNTLENDIVLKKIISKVLFLIEE